VGPSDVKSSVVQPPKGRSHFRNSYKRKAHYRTIPKPSERKAINKRESSSANVFDEGPEFEMVPAISRVNKMEAALDVLIRSGSAESADHTAATRNPISKRNDTRRAAAGVAIFKKYARKEQMALPDGEIERDGEKEPSDKVEEGE
jgi:hypothetical protein